VVWEKATVATSVVEVEPWRRPGRCSRLERRLPSSTYGHPAAGAAYSFQGDDDGVLLQPL